jgi:hypothetical protein
MERKMNTKLALSILIATAAATVADASTACPARQPVSYLGNPAPAQAGADKVIVITDKTTFVNVTGGSTVQFIVGERSFKWNFENGVAHVMPFDLQRIAPKGLLDHAIKVYVSEDPLYQS